MSVWLLLRGQNSDEQNANKKEEKEEKEDSDSMVRARWPLGLVAAATVATANAEESQSKILLQRLVVDTVTPIPSSSTLSYVQDGLTLQQEDISGLDNDAGLTHSHALRVDYDVEQTSATGGSAEFGKGIREGSAVVNCLGADAFSIYVYNREAQSAAGRASLRLRIADTKDCNPGAQSCEAWGEMETWGATISSVDLDTISTAWTYVRVPLADFARESGPVGTNEILDVTHVKAFMIQVAIDGTGSVGSTSTGSLLVRDVACEGDALFGKSFARSNPVVQGGSDEIFSLATANSLISDENTNFVSHLDGFLGSEQAAWEIDYVVERTQPWGGFTTITHLLPGEAVYDFGDSDYITFDFYNSVPQNPSGLLNLRMMLVDASDCFGPDCYIDYNNEVYFSFHFVLDYGPGWNTIRLPLVGDPRDEMPFVLKGWTGVFGNGVLDKRAIKGYKFEFSIGTNVPIGALTAGTFVLSGLRVEKDPVPEPPPPPSCHEATGFVIDGGHSKEIQFGQQQCCDICGNTPGCAFFQINDRVCLLYDDIKPENVVLKTEKYGLLRAFRVETGLVDACEGPSAPCACSGTAIDCRDANLTTLPLFNSATSAAATSLDLRDNPGIAVLSAGMLDGLDELTELKLRGTSLRFLDLSALPDSLSSVDVDVASLINVATSEPGPGKAFGDICCSRQMAAATETQSGLQLSLCESVQGSAPCVDCDLYPFSTYDKEEEGGHLLSVITPASLFGDGALEPTHCGELCTRTRDCTHFTWDGRHTQAEPNCFLLSDGMNPTFSNTSASWADPAEPNPGIVSGRVAATRALSNDAVVLISRAETEQAPLALGPETSFATTYTLRLASKPTRGSVWITPLPHFLQPAIAEERRVTLAVSPTLVVIDADEWDKEHIVTLNASVPEGATGGLGAEILHEVVSCDEGFILHPEQHDWLSVPLKVGLYRPTEDLHHSSSVKSFCFALCALNALVAVGFLVWVFAKRTTPVVRASQSAFLALFAVGGITTSLTIIPITMDDSSDSEGLARTGSFGPANLGCSLQIWLYALGFVLTFAPLFAKTWRLAKIVTRKDLKRVRISNSQVFGICAMLIVIEAVILAAWSAAAPLRYWRIVMTTDEVGNPTSSIGYCRSDNDSTPFLVAMFTFHLIILVYGNVILYKVKDLDNTALSEGQYIKLTLFSNLQVLALAAPLLIIVADDPVTTMFLRSGVIFLNNMCGLILIFYPKVVAVLQGRTSIMSSSSYRAAHTDQTAPSTICTEALFQK